MEMEFDKNGNIIRNKGTISLKIIPETSMKKGEKGERSYMKVDPRG